MRQSELTAEIKAIAEQSYQKLDGEWHDWLEVARKFEYKVEAQDRPDLRHTIIAFCSKQRYPSFSPPLIFCLITSMPTVQAHCLTRLAIPQ